MPNEIVISFYSFGLGYVLTHQIAIFVFVTYRNFTS